MKKRGILVFLLLTALFISSSIKVLATDSSDIKNQVWHFVDPQSVSGEYKIHTASVSSNHLRQIIFVSKTNNQKMSFTFSPVNRSLSAEALRSLLTNIQYTLAKSNGTNKCTNVRFNNFVLGNQFVPYFSMDQYFNKKFDSKAIIGVIPDYNGYTIIVQSYGDPNKYDQRLAEDFFRKVRFKTENF